MFLRSDEAAGPATASLGEANRKLELPPTQDGASIKKERERHHRHTFVLKERFAAHTQTSICRFSLEIWL